MMRIRTVVAVGSMALLGVAGTGSTALASDGGHAPTQPTQIKHVTGHPPNPAQVVRCFRANGGKVTRLKDGGYQIDVTAASARACKRYLPPGAFPKDGAKLVLRIGGSAKPKGPGKVDEKFVQCLKDNGVAVPGTVASDEKVGTVTGVPGDASVTKGQDGSVSVRVGGSAKPVDVPDECEPLAPGPILQESAG